MIEQIGRGSRSKYIDRFPSLHISTHHVSAAPIPANLIHAAHDWAWVSPDLCAESITLPSVCLVLLWRT